MAISKRQGRTAAQDRLIFQLVKVQAHGRQQVAAQFAISLRQVENAIRRAERSFLEEPEHPGEQRATRLQAHAQRLEHLFDEALDAWERSRQPQRQINVVWIKGEKVRESVEARSNSGDSRYLTNALLVAERLVDLAAQLDPQPATGRSRRRPRSRVIEGELRGDNGAMTR